MIISANSSIMEYIGTSTFENLSAISATANVGDVYNLTTSGLLYNGDSTHSGYVYAGDNVSFDISGYWDILRPFN